MEKEAMIIVDYHKAFGKTGGLPVAGAENLAPAIQNQMHLTRTASGLIVATRDWHPKDTVHFQKQGGPWPVHGVGGSEESEYIEGIDPKMIDHHIYKGYKNSDDGYSGFDGVDKLSGSAEQGWNIAPDARTLEQILRESQVKLLKIVGLATDFCVFQTAKSGKQLGFDIEVLRSGIAAVNVPGLPSGEDKLRELADMGVKIIESLLYILMRSSLPYTLGNSFAAARDEAEVDSLLNTDVYKFLMLDFILSHPEYQNMKVRWKMKVRNIDIRLADIIPESALREQLDKTRSIKGVSQADLSYLRGMQVGSRNLLKEDTLTFLRDFQLPEYDLQPDGQGGYDLSFEGSWAESMLWEIYGLKIVNSLYLYHYVKKAKLSPSEWNGVMTRMFARLYENTGKVKSDPRITFSEFGTRRAASTDIHRQVYEILQNELPGQCLGTSNVMLAKEFGQNNPKGTNAHELRMIPTAFEDTSEGIISKMYEVDRQWQLHYPELAILLPDTFGSSFYFANCPEDIAMKHTGCRIDSKDPHDAIPEYVDFLRKWNIDPKTRIALPSDGLTYDIIQGVTDRFHGVMGTLTNGWGTELSNNTKGTLPKEKETYGPFGSMSIVIKPDAVWRADKNAWVSCVKLSDNPNKAMGSVDRVGLFKRTFGVEGMEKQEVLV